MKRFVAMVLLAVVCGCTNEDIVILEGFEHGVCFCERTYKSVLHLDESTVAQTGEFFIVVNAGHEGDPEVVELAKLAHKVCTEVK